MRWKRGIERRIRQTINDMPFLDLGSQRGEIRTPEGYEYLEGIACNHLAWECAELFLVHLCEVRVVCKANPF